MHGRSRKRLSRIRVHEPNLILKVKSNFFVRSTVLVYLKYFILTASLLIVLAGCGGSKELEKSRPPEEKPMDGYEKTFRPSDYDMDVKVFLAEAKRGNDVKVNPPEPVVVEPAAIVQGYRVQLFATSEIDDANAKKSEAEAAFPGQWFYLEYDPPTYKLRAGNFLNRNDADSYARYLAENGFPDAWIVPDRVVKNIQPRVIPQPQDPGPPRQ